VGERRKTAQHRATPVIEIRRHVETDWPIEQVAMYLCDFTTTAAWHPHTVGCSRLDSGPLSIGSEFSVRRSGVMRASSRYRVTDLHHGRSITLRSRTRAAELTDTMTFDVLASGGTAVTYTTRASFKGLARAGESVLRSLLNRVGDDGAAGMAHILAHLDASTHAVV
jgi:hypothetical protein